MPRRALLVVIAAVLAAGTVSPAADAASLVSVRERRLLTVCAHPDALPFSSQDHAQPGFQIEIAEAIARQMGVRLSVQWIVFTRHARRLQCDAVMGSIVQKAEAGGKGPRLTLTKPYAGSGYVLVVPAAAADIARIEGITQGKVGVQHTSWPHYVLSTKKIATSSYGSQNDLLEAVAKGDVVAGFVTDAYVGWYLKLHPGALKIASAPMPDDDFRWNIAIRLYEADQALIDTMNATIDKLLADRTIHDIFGKYGVTYVPPRP